MTWPIMAELQKILSETLGYDTFSFGVTNLLYKSSLKKTWSITPQLRKLPSEISGYDTFSFGVTNLLYKSSLKMTWSITPQLRKLLSEISGYDTLSFGEGRGEATNWLSKFYTASTPIIILANARGPGVRPLHCLFILKYNISNLPLILLPK